MKLFLVIFLIFPLCFSCNFRVIYEDRTDVISYAKELAAIRIKKDRNHLSQELKNNLYDVFNPDYLEVEPKYFLILKTSNTISPTFITITGASGRNKVTINASYELKNLKTAEIIAKGSTSVNDNYNVNNNRYGTYTAEEYTKINLTKVAAQNIRNSLVNDIIEMRKKCEEQESKKNEEFVCPLN
jgi:hypothetical protein